MKEELSTQQHGEFTVDQETEIKHRVWTAQGTVDSGLYTLKEALKWYDLTEEQYNKYKDSWKK